MLDILNFNTLERRVRKLEDTGKRILDLHGLPNVANFSDDIHKLRQNSRYMRIVRKLTQNFIMNKEDLPYGQATVNEIKMVVEFVTVLAHRVHLAQERKLKLPYILHCMRMNELMAKHLSNRKISYISTCTNNVHDVVEEIEKELKSVDTKRKLALRVQIPLEIFNFVNNEESIRNKSEFYRGIFSINKILSNLTKRKDQTHIAYLKENIFYPDEQKFWTPEFSLDELCSLSEYMPGIYGVQDVGQLIRYFFRSVEENYSPQFKDRKLIKKLGRRTQINKNLDSITNVEDLTRHLEKSYAFPTYIRIYRYFKGFFVDHGTFEKYSKQHKREQEEYNKIIPLSEVLLHELIKQSAQDLERISSLIGPAMSKAYNNSIDKYMQTKMFMKLTSQKEDRTIFAGTVERYLRMLDDSNAREEFRENPYRLYADLAVLHSHLVRFQHNYDLYNQMTHKYDTGRINPEFIGRFSLRNLNKIVEGFKNDLPN